MRLFRPMFLAATLYPEAIFRIKTAEKILTLTFDDGPDPSSTISILDKIEKYNIRAIFFCTGKSAKEYPELIERIKSGGHLIGNHSFSHIDGFRTKSAVFLKDVEDAAEFTSAKIFRPPYGRMTPYQYRILKKKYSIVMWDLMAYDFDISFGRDKVLNTLKNRIRPGSIVVLHDTPSGSATEVVEDFIRYSLNLGFRFEIPSQLA